MKFTKKIGCILLSAMLLVGVLSSLTVFAETKTSGIYTYEVLENGTIKITGNTNTEANLVIPETVDGYVVSEIGERAFSETENEIIQTVVMPDTITKIENGAFSNCRQLVSIDLSDSLVTLGYDVFTGSGNLTELTLPGSLKSITKNKFINTGIKKLILSEGMQSIGDYALMDNNLLETIVLPSTLNSIGIRAFKNCSALKEITIPGSVKNIEHSAFQYCRALEKVEICDGVELIEYDAFYDCENIKNLTLPNTLTTIGSNAFLRCQSLETLCFPDTLKSIGESAFAGCTGLTEITGGKYLNYLSAYAFSGCTGLKKLLIPASVKIIGENILCNVEGVSIHGYVGSVAETYALENFIPFIDVLAVPTTEITLDKTKVNLYLKGNYQIKATVKNSVEDTIFESSDTSIVKVNKKGKITAVGIGTATVVVVNGNDTKIVKVTVKKPRLNTNNAVLKAKSTMQLKINGKIGKAVFISSNRSVAKVNTNGVVKAIKKGNAVIKVKTNGVTLKCKVKVK